MKLVAGVLLMFGAAWGQVAVDKVPEDRNAVSPEMLKKRLEAMKLLKSRPLLAMRQIPMTQIPMGQIRMTCAVPLREALSPEDRTDYKIRIYKPAQSIEQTANGAGAVGVPPCK